MSCMDINLLLRPAVNKNKTKKKVSHKHFFFLPYIQTNSIINKSENEVNVHETKKKKEKMCPVDSFIETEGPRT